MFTVGPPEESLAGSSFTITCTATETYPGYLMMPTAMWLNSDEEEPSGEDISITSSQNDTSATSMLTFNSLRLTDAAEFTCVGQLTSFINTEVRQSYTLVVLSKLSSQTNGSSLDLPSSLLSPYNAPCTPLLLPLLPIFSPFPPHI